MFVIKHYDQQLQERARLCNTKK